MRCLRAMPPPPFWRSVSRRRRRLSSPAPRPSDAAGAGRPSAAACRPAAATAARPSTDPFGVEMMLTPKTIIFMKGNSTWDKALDNLQDAFKSVYAWSTAGPRQAGPSMTIYTSADDTGFSFRPRCRSPKRRRIRRRATSRSASRPAASALKFVHRGSYNSMDSTYEAITNYLDEKRLEAAEFSSRNTRPIR